MATQHVSRSADKGSRQLPSLIVRAGAAMLSLGAADVREMISIPEVRAVPDVPPFVRGVINLRGTVMPVVDLRQRLGMMTGADEGEQLADLLGARLQDHRRWVDELAASVADRRPFELTTDPHACAFGRWYDAFRTENVILERTLKRFDAPHKRIHAIGDEVKQLMAAHDYESCDELIDSVRNTVLSALTKLFEEAMATVRSRHEIAVVVQHADRAPYAIAVDSIEAVERLRDDAVTPVDDVLGGLYHQELIGGIARRSKDGQLVLVLRPESLL